MRTNFGGKSQYASFNELWRDIEKQTENLKLYGKKCIESFEKIPNLEGVKIFGTGECTSGTANLKDNEAIIMKDNLIFRIYYLCDISSHDCKNRFNQILSTFQFLE